jgi:hypothetical protein
MGITKDGEAANNLFCEITGFNSSTTNDPRGDAYENDIWCEVKKNTFNQVRPYRYNVLVGYNKKMNPPWCVIPADEVISMCIDKRGQHTTNQMECMNAGRFSKKDFIKYRVQESDLRQKVLDAYNQANQNTKFKRYADTKKQEFQSKPSQITEEIRLLKETQNA